MSMQETAEFFRVSESTIRNARGDFARLAHVHVGKRHLIVRESAETLAADLVKRAKSVSAVVREMSDVRRAG
jgi:hypothetical protein